MIITVSMLFIPTSLSSNSTISIAHGFKMKGPGIGDYHVGEPIHETISQSVTKYLKQDISNEIIAGHKEADGIFLGHQEDSEYHFDDCELREGSEHINKNYQQILNLLENPTDENLEDAAKKFGIILHASQDFYAHTNWIESGNTVIVDNGRSFWDVMIPFDTKYAEKHGMIVVEGEKIPDGFTIKKNKDEHDKFDKTITVTTKNKNYEGLVSGSVYAFDNCIDNKILDSSIGGTFEHWDNFGIFDNTGLNKDGPERKGHSQAYGLALEQTEHEWCRLVNLVHEEYPKDGVDTLFEKWVKPDQYDEAKAMCQGELMFSFAVDEPNTFSFLMFAVQDTNGDIYTAQLESANFETPLVNSEQLSVFFERSGWQKEYKGIQLDIEIPDTFQQIANDPENPKYTLVYLGNCVSPLEKEIEPSVDFVQSYFANSAWGYPVGLIFDDEDQFVTFSSDSCEDKLPNLHKVDLSSERQITFFEQIPRNISKFFLNLLRDGIIDQIFT